MAALKEAFWGFSHIRNAEQLGPHKRIIYTEALKGKGKLSSFLASPHGRTSLNVHTEPHSHGQVCEQPSTRTIVQLSALLTHTMGGLDLTLQSVLLLSNRCCHSRQTRGEFSREVKGDSRGSAGSIPQNQRRTGPFLCARGPFFPVTAPGLICCEWRGRDRVRTQPCLIVKDSNTLGAGGSLLGQYGGLKNHPGGRTELRRTRTPISPCGNTLYHVYRRVPPRRDAAKMKQIITVSFFYGSLFQQRLMLKRRSDPWKAGAEWPPVNLKCKKFETPRTVADNQAEPPRVSSEKVPDRQCSAPSARTLTPRESNISAET